MILITNSNDFEKIFLRHEYDSTIIKTQFVIVSTRIKKKTNSNENIVVATRSLYPGIEFYDNEDDKDKAREAYYRQLDCSKPFLAAIVKGSIKKNYNIIFICSDNEWKQGYLKFLKDYIIQEFEYPVYNYRKYVYGCSLYQYSDKRSLKICNRILKKVKEKSEEELAKTFNGRKRLIHQYKKMETKDLIKRIKNIGLYHKNMRRDEMLDILETFI